jgi:hypothetical protein
LTKALPHGCETDDLAPFTQHGLGEPIPLVTHADGASLFTADGARVVDAISSWWVTTHGHAHPRIAAAIADQAGRLDQLIFAGWTHQPAQDVAEGLVAMAGEALGPMRCMCSFPIWLHLCGGGAENGAGPLGAPGGKPQPYSRDAAFLSRRHDRRDERGERGVQCRPCAAAVRRGRGAFPHDPQVSYDALDAPVRGAMWPPSLLSR